MHSYIAIIGMAAAAAAQTTGFHAINLPGMNEAVPACSTYNVKWTPSTSDAFAGDVVFGLIGGPTQQTLQPIGGIFGSAAGASGTFAWDVPCDEGAEAIYGLKIFLATDSSIFQFSMPFQITPVEGGGETETPVTEEPTPSETESPTETEAETDAEETEEPTHFPGHNSTTTVEPPATTEAPGNGTVTTGQPTGTIFTSFTTEDGTDETATPEPTRATAGASSVSAGSFAFLAVAAAFFAL